jgi:hypothetical protein
MRNRALSFVFSRACKGRQLIVVLHQLFEVAPPLVRRVVDFLEPIQPQQLGQFVSVDAVTLIGVFGDPGVALRMRTDHASHQRRDHRRGPGRQLPGFQMHVYLTLQIREGFAQIGCAGAEVAIHSAHPMVIQSHLLKITRPKIEPDVAGSPAVHHGWGAINYAHADVSFP